MGDKVKKDDVLVRLENEEFAAQVKQQQGQLDSAKAKLAELENGSRPQEIAQAKAASGSGRRPISPTPIEPQAHAGPSGDQGGFRAGD